MSSLITGNSIIYFIFFQTNSRIKHISSALLHVCTWDRPRAHETRFHIHTKQNHVFAEMFLLNQMCLKMAPVIPIPYRCSLSFSTYLKFKQIMYLIDKLRYILIPVYSRHDANRWRLAISATWEKEWQVIWFFLTITDTITMTIHERIILTDLSLRGRLKRRWDMNIYTY